MRNTFISFLSLFLSCFILLLGSGLINVLLPVRMGVDGFNTETIGLVLSLYYVGMLIGALYSKNLIARAGHIRMFAGCVAVGAVSILICSLYSDAVLWGTMRLLMGFCNACAFTAMESWLSDSSTKETRGKVLAVYNAVVLAGLFGGQFFMNIADPSGTTLFVLAGIFLCASIVPVVLSNNSGPVIDEVESMSLLKLYKISPLGVVSCVISGLTYSALFNLLPMFAKDYGIVEFHLSIYIGTAIFAAFILQFPVGYLSDHFDRRTVLFVLLLVSAAAGFSIIALANLGYFSAMFFATAISSGIVACTYPISIAEVFDRLRQSEMVAAMGCMILAFSVGGVLGPYTASVAMDNFGGDALFYYLAFVQLLLAVFVLYRMSARHALPVADQEQFVMQGAAITASVDLDPRSEFVEQVPPLTVEAETAVTVAEVDPAAAVKMARAVALTNPALGVGVAAAVATVDGIDVLRLYEVMKESVPEQILDVTHAIVTTRPELAYELVSKLAEWHPDQVVDVAAQIGQAVPQLRVEMAQVAVEAAPESATQVAEYYAQVLAQEHEEVRPADREDDTSEKEAINIAAQLWLGPQEQALGVTVAMVDALPESAVPLVQEYIANSAFENDNPEKITTDDAAYVSGKEFPEPLDNAEQNREQLLEEPELEIDYPQTVELVSRLAEVAPHQALDVAVAVVEAVPESAAEVAAEMASNISDRGYSGQPSLPELEESGIQESEDAVELVQRITEASPDNAMDVAVAVVEIVPNSAVEVAAEYAGNIADEGSSADVEKEEAVELLQRMTEASPEHAMDVAVAVVEAVPESAAEVASEYAENISDAHSGADQSHQEAVELVQRLSEVTPGSSMDVAVAVVEAIPESASEIVDAISEGDEPEDGEFSVAITQKPAE